MTSRCRVCLNSNTKMYNIFDNNFLAMFESVTGIMLTDEYSFICYLCAALLKKCNKFKKMALQVEEILTAHKMHSEREKSIMIIKNSCKLFKSNLMISKIVQFNLIISEDGTHHKNYDVSDEIKLEDDGFLSKNHDNCDNIKDIDLKQNENLVTKDENYVYNEDSFDNLDLNECSEGKEKKDLVLSIDFDVKKLDSDCMSNFSDEDLKPLLSKKSKLSKKKNIKKKKSVKLKKEKVKQKVSKKTSSAFNRNQLDVSDFAILKTLTYEEQLEEIEARKTSTNYLNSPFKCDHCFKGFLTKSSFDNHTLTHMPVSGDHECPICKIRTTAARILRTHIVKSHANKYQCKQCEFISRTPSQAKGHHMWHEGHEYKCDQCGAVFSKRTSMRSHVRIHHPSAHVCPHCGASFVGNNGLSQHITRMHSKTEKLEADVEDSSIYCKECDIQFTNINAFSKHIVTSPVHADQKDVSCVCHECGEQFSSSKELKMHKTKHQRVNCQLCNAPFENARVLREHRKRAHPGEKFAPPKRIRNKIATCEICGKLFVSNAHLVMHQRTHTGEKPFKCNECNSSFATKQFLKIHNRIHTGERPYNCPYCCKAFRSITNLSVHKRTHTGARPYVCHICHKAFSQSYAKKVHVNTVHLKMPDPSKGKRRKKKITSDDRSGGIMNLLQ